MVMESTTNRAPGNDGAPASAESREKDELLEFLLRSASRIESATDDFRVLAAIGSDRLRLRVRKALGLAQWVVVGFLAVIALLLAGVVVLAIGTERAFVALFAERPWLGQLAAGFALIGAAIGLVAAAQALARRAHAKKLEEKYADAQQPSRRIAPTA